MISSYKISSLSENLKTVVRKKKKKTNFLKFCPGFTASEFFVSNRVFCSDVLIVAFLTYLTISHLNIYLCTITNKCSRVL
jgi:hypothetical protein